MKYLALLATALLAGCAQPSTRAELEAQYPDARIVFETQETQDPGAKKVVVYQEAWDEVSFKKSGRERVVHQFAVEYDSNGTILARE
jgi:hypothetical protein